MGVCLSYSVGRRQSQVFEVTMTTKQPNRVEEMMLRIRSMLDRQVKTHKNPYIVDVKLCGQVSEWIITARRLDKVADALDGTYIDQIYFNRTSKLTTLRYGFKAEEERYRFLEKIEALVISFGVKGGDPKDLVKAR